MSRRLKLAVLTLFALALAGACSSPPPKAGPKFTGRLIVLSAGDLIEVTADTNSTFKRSTLVSGVAEAVAGSDQASLLFATSDKISLRNLGTNEMKELKREPGYCLAWSTDARRFSYKQRNESSIKLFASDLNGNSQLVWEERFPEKQTGPDILGCASWVAADKLIFDRFGPSQKKGGDVKPNTTTLATLNGSVKLVDVEKKWSVEGVCKTGSALLRSIEGQILVAKNLENLKSVNPSSGPCSACRFAGFAANSCVPFFIEDSSSTSSDVFYLNPTNWQRQRSGHIGQPFSVNARMLINSGARLMVVGDAPSTLLLIDTETGEMTNLFPKTGGAPGSGEIESPRPVVWIEK